MRGLSWISLDTVPTRFDVGTVAHGLGGFSLQKSALRLVVPTPINGTVPPRRKPNSKTRDREHLTEAEIERLMKAAGENR
jgi:hypothetical protein